MRAHSSCTATLHRVFASAIALAAALFLLGMLASSAQAQTAPGMPANPSLMVKMIAGLTAEQQADVIARNGGTEIKKVAALRLHVIEVLDEQLDGVYQAYLADPQVQRVEINKVRQTDRAPTDPLYTGQWALPKIGFDQIPDDATPAGGATVAVLDTGVDASHPDLAGRVAFGTSILDGSNGMSDPNGHGTAVAGIIAARNNNEGIAGAAFAGVGIMPVTVLNAQGLGQDSDVIAGVIWAAEHGANVIVMAFSNPGQSESLQEAIDYAWSMGAVIVAAAGNDAWANPSYPAGDRGVMGVASTDQGDAISWFSNTGTAIFMAAPGEGIMTTTPGGGYSATSGTSSSAAYVAAAAALVKAFDPSASNGIIVGRLARSADPVDGAGNGRLNLARALSDTSTEAVQPAGVEGGGGPFVGPYRAAARQLDFAFAGTGGGTVQMTANNSPPDTVNANAACGGTGGAAASQTINKTCANIMFSNNSGSGTMTATPNSLSYFQGWSGAANITGCTGSTSSCNYSLIGSNPTLTATFNLKTSVTATVTASNKTYDGINTASATCTVSPVASGETVTCTIGSATFNDASAGNGKTVTATGITIGGADAFKYTLSSPTATTTANIDKKPASATANAASKTYGDADPAFTGTISGFLPADGVTATYSRTAGETVAGSPYTISATLSPAGVLGNYDITYTNANFTINKKNASVTPAVASKTYGDVDPAFTGTLSGFLTADNVTATYSRTAGETVLGSPYTISATLSPAGVLNNYNITYNTANFTINKRDASVTPNAASKQYGDADPALTGTLSGFMPADGVTATYTRTAGNTVLGGPYTISATLSPAGVLSNYNITYNTASFTISPRPASVTPNAASKVYGDGDPAFSGTLSGFLPADGVTATYIRTAGETVLGSPYTISATLSPAGVLSNYSITNNTAPFTINPRPASVTPSGASKVYGDADPAFSGTLSGFLPADGVTATYNRTAGETVLGSPYTISATLSPAGVLSNYSITNNSAAFTINPRPASVTPNVASKVYGDADPAFTGTLSGFISADGVTATYSRTNGDTVAGGPYTISATLSPAAVLSNYTVTYNTAAFTITARPASVTPAAAGKVYGAPEPVLTGTLTGFMAADGVTATYSRTAGESVAGGPYTISATLAPAGVLANYAITYNTAAFTINARPASVTPNAASKTYGDADPAYSGTLVGFLGGDGVTATYSRTAGETVAGSPYTISATLAPAGVLANYVITYNTATFTINARTASVTPNAASKTYGDADPAFTGTLTGFLEGDGVTATFSRNAGDTVNGGPYTISAALAPAGVLANYAITYNTASFTINARTASVTPNAASKTYGDADPAFTGTLAGFLGSDGVTATYSRTAGDSVGGSPYTISATLAPAGVLANYAITYNTASFTITARTASVAPDPKSKAYGSADPVLTGTLSGFLPADGVTASYSRTAGEGVAGSPYTISATLAGTGSLANYSITYNTASFTITKANPTVTVSGATCTYNGLGCVGSGSATGVLGEPLGAVNLAYATTPGPGNLLPSAPVNAGSYYVSARFLGDSNYNAAQSPSPATILINQAPVTPSVNASNKVYDANASATVTCSVGGVIAGDAGMVTCAAASASFSDANVGMGKTVTATGITLSGTKSSNYVLTSATATTAANITVKYVTASVTAADKNYDGNTTATINSCTLTGKISGTDVSCSAAAATFDTKDFGTGKTVTATGISLAGADAGNYQLTATTATTTANINSWWTLQGFFSPVDMNGVYNSVKAGSTVPLKFRIFAGSTEKKNVSDVQNMVLAEISCSGAMITDDLEETATGGTSLRYDTTGSQFIFNWQTQKNTSGRCYRMTMVAQDGSSIAAFFKMK